MNVYAVIVSMVMMTSVAFAQTMTLTRGIGLDAIAEIGPDNPLYGLDMAIDNLLVGVGMARQGDLLQERVSEAYRMQIQGKYQYMTKALDQVRNMYQKVSDPAALENAEAIMTQMQTRASVENAGELDEIQSMISTKLGQATGCGMGECETG